MSSSIKRAELASSQLESLFVTCAHLGQSTKQRCSYIYAQVVRKCIVVEITKEKLFSFFLFKCSLGIIGYGRGYLRRLN